jgi:small-conductance mechanosensitive channel
MRAPVGGTPWPLLLLRSTALAALVLWSAVATCKAEVAPSDPASAQSNPTNAQRLAKLWQSVDQAVSAVARLREAPDYWREETADLRDGGGALERFWLIVIAGLLAAPLIGSVMRRLFDRGVMRISWREDSRLRTALLRAAASAISLPVFAALFWLALVGASSGNRLLEEAADRIVWAALEWRIAITVLIIVFSPRRGDLRLLRIDDGDARRCMHWLGLYATVSPLNYCFLWLIERTGLPHAAVFGAALILSLTVTTYKIAMFWAVRRPIARAILAATDSEPSPFRRAVAAGWHWFFILLSLVVLIAATIAFALGEGASVYGAATITQIILVILAIAWQAGQKLIDHLAARARAAASPTVRRVRFTDAWRRLCDALVLLLGITWLGKVWGLDLIAPPPGSVQRLLLRPSLLAAATVIAAWIIWLVLSGIIDERMPRLAAPGDDDGDMAAHVSRLGTLLPLLRNVVLLVIGMIALAVALSSLGVNLAPLLAGLGVIGIALGFGAQNLVRDIISGIFFLMEDAFRVGEYIDTGRLRGTVEGMSLRSVRLRHQNGPVHTIPFGQVQAVTNYSRDWAVVKFNLHLDPAIELEVVRKTIKRVGQELLEDPEIGAEFISPLKMQGVTDVLQTALILRCKFTSLPGRPTYLQRQALHRLIAAFGDAEIRFAATTVTIQLSGA